MKSPGPKNTKTSSTRLRFSLRKQSCLKLNRDEGPVQKVGAKLHNRP